jgi:hypothetical protein
VVIPPIVIDQQGQINKNVPSTGDTTEAQSAAPSDRLEGRRLSQIEEMLKALTAKEEASDELQDLALTRKILRDELAKPQTANPRLLVQTKLAVTEAMIHYGIFRKFLLGKGPQREEMIKYHTDMINLLIKDQFSNVATSQRTSLCIDHPLSFTKEDHLEVMKFFYLDAGKAALPHISYHS